jgi:hypothetical protein
MPQSGFQSTGTESGDNSPALEKANTPVGQGNYEVQHGDCLTSIAGRFGFLWETLWNLPENAELKYTRKNPNVLLPGDRLTIPEIKLRQYTAETDKQHSFVKLGTPAKLRLRFFEDGEPRAGESYVLTIGGEVRFGKLDGNGQLLEPIPPTADSARLSINNEDPIALKLGTVDPITEISGIQGRLSNLGYYGGQIDKIIGPKTRAALRHFQQRSGLPATGKVTQATRDKLLEAHGC